MRFLGAAVILAIMGVMLISSGGAPVGAIGPEPARPAPAADTKPPIARSRPEVQRGTRVLADRDRDAVFSLVLLLGMYEGRHGR